MPIRTKPITSSLIAAAGIFAFAHHTAVLAGPIATYTIDQEHSYISAYVPDEWVNGGGRLVRQRVLEPRLETRGFQFVRFVQPRDGAFRMGAHA